MFLTEPDPVTHSRNIAARGWHILLEGVQNLEIAFERFNVCAA
jgi:hypothetical protein